MLKSIGIFLLNAAIYLGSFFAASQLHNNLFYKSQAYSNFSSNNPTIWLISVLTIGFVFLWIIQEVKKRVFGSPGLFKAASFRAIPVSLLGPLTIIGVTCTLLFISLVSIPYLKSSYPALNQYVDDFMGQYFIVTLIGVAVVGAVYEELLFRGLIVQQMWNAKFGFIIALILHGLLYAYFQPSVPISFVAFFLAMMYYLLFYKIRSLWVTIYIAMLINGLLVIARKTGVYESIAGWNSVVLHASVIACLAIIIALLVYLYKPSNSRYHHIGHDAASIQS